jgi:hypothetical protein
VTRLGRHALFVAVGIAVATAVPADRLQHSILQHKDWIEDCTDRPVSVAKSVLILYSVKVERDRGELVYCLLSTGRRVMEDSLSLGDHADSAVMFLPSFPNGYNLRTGSSVTVAEALIQSEERVLVVSAPYADLGIERVEPVSEHSFLVQVGYVTHSRVFHVTSHGDEAFFLTSGEVAALTRSEDGSCRIHVKSTKGYFKGGGPFWFDATIDCEGNILDIVTKTSDCMSVEVVAERSGLDLSRLKRQAICIER